MIGRLAKSIRQYLPSTIISPLCMIGEVYMEVQIPLVLAKIVDQGVELGNMDAVWCYGLILVLYSLMSLAFGVASAVAASHAGTGFARNLRHDMFHRVQTFDFSNIDRLSTSSIVTRLTSDIATLQMTFQMLIRIAVRCPMMLILATANAFTISPKLCIVYCIVLPLLCFGLMMITKIVHPTFVRVFKTYDKLNNVVQENLHGIRVVKSYVREAKEVSKFQEISGSIYADFCKAEKTLAFNSPFMQSAAYICILVISWLGAHMVVQSGNGAISGGLTTGQLTSMFAYTTQILGSLMMFSMIFVMLILSRAPLQRTYEVLTEEPALRNPENPVMEVADGSIDFEDVTFRYSETAPRDSLEHVSVHIDSGMTVGILGVTGSSKSTLVQLIPRLYDVTSGCLKVGGVDVRNYDVETLRNAVSMVLQKNTLFAGSIKDNLRWGNPDATDEELIHACKLACADDFIQGFPDGYDTHIEQGGSNVSGGQKQRLCIARALLKKPRILILDDSTSAVDTRTDASIRKAFAEEIPGTTKLIIAQRVSSVQDSDLILVMENGTIAAMGTHDELLRTSHIYREVFESQTKGGDE